MAQNNANSGIPRGEVIHGARGYITINGKRVGYVQGISVSCNVNLVDVDVLDNILPEEQVEVGVTYSGTITFIEVFSRSLREAGITTNIADIFSGGRSMDIAILDRPKGEVWKTLRTVKLQSRNFDYRKGSMTATQASFRALDMTDKDGIVDI